MSVPLAHRRPPRDTESTSATSTAILALVSSGAARTRVELAKALGVSASTVTVKVADLIGAGLLEDDGRGAPTGGRRARLLSVAPRTGLLMAAALGRRHARIGAVDLTGTLLQVREVALDVADGPDVVMPALADVWQEMADGLGQATLRAVGLSLPGPVDVRAGAATAPAEMPGWSGWSVSDWLEDRFGARAVVDNDANMSALGEHTARAGRGEDVRALLFIKAGTSLGGGLVLDGRVHRGSTWIGGDIGHVRVGVAGALPCVCGSFGCLETVVAGRSLVEDLRRAGVEVATTTDLVRLAELGHPEATARLRRAGSLLGETLATVVNVVNPDVVAIGGALSSSRSFVTALQSRVAEHCHPLATRDLRIEPTISGPDAEVIGAAQLALRYAIARLQGD